jgi:GntR family transcriptional regulator, transcriptional repressor for pyruvate dehydrogenase complex
MLLCMPNLSYRNWLSQRIIAVIAYNFLKLYDISEMQRKANQSVETVAKLKSALKVQGLKPGDSLPPELELAALLNVSRPVVREALSVMDALGICTPRKGSGRVLTGFHFGDALDSMMALVDPPGHWLRDLLAIRQALESAMLARAFPLMTEATFQELEQLTTTMEEKAARGEYFGAEDRRFHLALYENLNNDALNGLLQLFWSMYDRLDANSLSHSQHLDETAAHHRKILDALKSGDVRRAQHQLDAHFYDTAYALEKCELAFLAE